MCRVCRRRTRWHVSKVLSLLVHEAEQLRWSIVGGDSKQRTWAKEGRRGKARAWPDSWLAAGVWEKNVL
jgi:hypothetical protein